MVIYELKISKGKLARLNILNKAFELVYRQGYQTTSIDDIIASTSVTKGSFYHLKKKIKWVLL